MKFGELWRRLRFAFRQNRFERELEEEVRLHVELRAEKLRARGLLHHEATYAAERQFGNKTLAIEESRRMWTVAWIEAIIQDLRYAGRILRKSPAFTLTAIVTLGVGLGVHTTIFTLFNTFVLRPFAVRDPYSLYQVQWRTRATTTSSFSWHEFDGLRNQRAVFSDVAAVDSMFRAMVNHQPMLGWAVSGNYFSMLGGSALVGRAILEQDDLIPGEGAVMVLSHQLWKIRFASDPAIVGSKLLVNGYPLEVIGVMRPEFQDPMGTNLICFDHPCGFWVPLSAVGRLKAEADLFGVARPSRLAVIARLKPGVLRQQAESGLLGYAQRATVDRTPDLRATGVSLTSKATRIPLTPRTIAGFIPLFVAFGLVLLICCANVANMMLARGLTRQREIGLRISLGASRGRVIRQLLTEGLLIALAASLVGVAIASAATQIISRILSAFWRVRAPAYFAPDAMAPFVVDYRVFAFALVIAGFVTVAFALLPALQLTRPMVSHAIRGEFGGIRPSRLRNFLLAGQVAVCSLLLISASVLLRESAVMHAFDPGFQAHGVFVVEVSKKRLQDVAVLLNRQNWMEPVAFAQRAPLDDLNSVYVGLPNGNLRVRMRTNFVSPEYFSVLRIPVIRGRNFTSEEAISGAPLAVVSEATARQLWPGEGAVGKTIQIDQKELNGVRLPFAHAEVIGVARDIANGGVYAGLDRTCVYFPTYLHGAQGGLMLARGKGDVALTARLGKEALAEISSLDSSDESWYMDPFTPLETSLEMQLIPLKMASWLASLLGALALMLTVSGVYGVVSYLVSQRTKEIGIRVALGATRPAVVRLVLGYSVKLAFGGMIVGVLLALAASKILAANLVLGITQTFDPVAYGGGIAMVMIVAVGAALGPARRAIRLEPAAILRSE